MYPYPALTLRTVTTSVRLQGASARGNGHVFLDVQQSRHLIDILVTPPREVDDDELVESHGGGETEGVRYGVSAFERWYDAFEVAEQYKRLKRLRIGRDDVGGTTALPESGLFRPTDPAVAG